ncbi:MAG: UDP-N-acetylglucosamine 1-carboxyvinyltransferase [Phycisphaerae bacterium]
MDFDRSNKSLDALSKCKKGSSTTIKMDKFIVDGRASLEGEVTLSGAKNSALPIIVASLLAEGQYRLSNVPNLLDIQNLLNVLRGLGVSARLIGNVLYLATTGLAGTTVDRQSAGKIRYSLLLMGALLARSGHVRIAPPGGCKIGLRKYDLHLYGLERLGAEVETGDDYIEVRAPRGLKGAYVNFYFPSMTATENIILAAVMAEGETVLNNAQRDPEIVDFVNFLKTMGARISGAGTGRIIVEGGRKLHPVDYTVMPDRMELITFIAASAATRGEIFIRSGRLKDIEPEARVLKGMGISLYQDGEGLMVRPAQRFSPINIEAQIWPYLHSDAQPFFTVLACLADGTSTITDLLYDKRFVYIGELSKMGADVQVVETDFIIPSGKHAQKAIITPVKTLKGAQLTATDIRGGAAMLIAALAAEGRTVVSNIQQIDRGYELIDKKLRKLGAHIECLGR